MILLAVKQPESVWSETCGQHYQGRFEMAVLPGLLQKIDSCSIEKAGRMCYAMPVHYICRLGDATWKSN